MSKINCFLICLILFFISCSDKKKEETVNFQIIKEKEMINILYDLHLTDGVINAYNNEEQANIFLSDKHYANQIFKKYNCTDTIFKLNIEYYTVKGTIKDIYASVIDSMNIIKGRLEQHRQDKGEKKKTIFTRRSKPQQ